MRIQEARSEPRRRPRWVGPVAAVIAVATWASYFGLARDGVKHGLHASDFMLLRFGVAGLLLAPVVLLRWGEVRAMGAWRSLVLTVLVGPLFILLAVGGYTFAPLAHGAVQPVTVTVVVTLAAAVLLNETLTRQRLIGVIIAVAGIAMVGLGGASPAAGTGPTWIGDLLFACAGLCWATYILLLRYWRLDPVLATAVPTALAAAVIIPAFFVWDTPVRLASLPVGTLVAQVMVQGVMSGVVAMLAFGFAVKELGASRAALFPVMVPIATALIGVPITGEMPAPVQAAGLLLATLGLLGAVVSWGPATPRLDEARQPE